MFRNSSPPRDGEPAWTRPKPGFKGKRGAKKTPEKIRAAAPHFKAPEAPPAQFASVPGKLSMWGNDEYGDCVSAEEAYAKATYAPEIFVTDETVIAWARAHNVLDGATLDEVLDAMRKAGFANGPQLYNDGDKAVVDWQKEAVLRAAIATGPVKIAIDADALPTGAGNQQGWYALGKGRYPNTDHCVALTGYGPASWLFQQLGVTLPSGLNPDTQGYLLFTWSTIGFVDFPWLQGTCEEAWIRNPTTVGVPPLPGPTPPPPPPPPPGPGPEGLSGSITITSPADAAGVYQLGGARPGPDQLAALAQAVNLIQSVLGEGHIDTEELRGGLTAALMHPQVAGAVGKRVKAGVTPLQLIVKIVATVVPVILNGLAAGKTVQEILPDIIAAILAALAG